MSPWRLLAWIGCGLLALLAVGMRASAADGNPPAAEERRAEIHVGVDAGDIRGDDNRVLQAAVDQVAALGGGTVHVGPGRYLMRNALALRDNVRVVGVPGKTILAACDGVRVRLAADGDCNERQITLEDAAGLHVGDGVAVADERNAHGFTVTTATLTAQVDAKTFRISAPLYLDYMVRFKATARIGFPVVAGCNVKNIAIEGLTIDGNRLRTEKLDGCRGGGIYLFQCEQAAIRSCVVRSYNGDGISFQVSDRVTVEDCICVENSGLGLHPGSGSQRPVLRRNRSLNNGGDGLFVCWRVKHGVFEANEVRGNGGVGVSIGHKDTDNLFRGNIIEGNRGAGVLFRDETEPMGAYRNVFEKNRIVDNGVAGSGPNQPCIIVLGHHHDVAFRNNVIGFSRPASTGVAAVRLSKVAKHFRAADNQLLNIKTEIQTEK